eukprot:TRINITY_DN5124_c0_g1_i1.p1 TRINITY_DN5124_c0_g1~~TRINITY_DN5124_c0_g1_i1.p1  ORF type:complete len:301 (-),score=69.28 TRINITY_DN5124_c0_g1_i1:24-851(-)
MVSFSRAAAAACLAAASVGPAAAYVLPSGATSAAPSANRGAAQTAAATEFVSNNHDVKRIADASAAMQDSDDWLSQCGRWLAGGLAAGLVAAAFCSPAEAYTSGYDSWNPARNWDPAFKWTKRVDLCKNNKKFAKRIKTEIYKVQQRQKKYPEGSVVYNRFVDKIALIKRREVAYGDRYCGKLDGLPRVMVQPGVKSGGVVVPSLIFLYIAGWIGWAGRSYLLRTRDPQKEIILDVPLALTCMASGFAWPVLAWQDIVNGEMVVPDEDFRNSSFS